MKKFISRTILFLIFSAVFYITTLFIWGRYAPAAFKPNINYRIGSYGHLYSRLSEVKNQKDIDILFLGSSHAYRGFDTRIFANAGLKTFNLGSSSQTPIQTKILLNRYLENLNPKLIIYEVFPETFTNDGVESSLDLIANGRNDLLTLEMVLKINNIKTYNTFTYGLLYDLFNLNKSFIEPPEKDEDTYIPGGFVEKELSYFKPHPIEENKTPFNQTQLEYFSEIITLIKDKNIELILVYAPITQVSYHSYTNTSDFDSLMESYSEYYNFNEIISLNDSLHFYDWHHLNQNGVELFNAKLMEVLNDR